MYEGYQALFWLFVFFVCRFFVSKKITVTQRSRIKITPDQHPWRGGVFFFGEDQGLNQDRTENDPFLNSEGVDWYDD